MHKDDAAYMPLQKRRNPTMKKRSVRLLAHHPFIHVGRQRVDTDDVRWSSAGEFLFQKFGELLT
jgi:hypothetical protein